MNYNQDTEIVSVVDQYNQEIAGASRKEMREQGFIHRSSYIIVYNLTLKKFYIQIRSPNKKFCPLFYDLCFGGVVEYQESYNNNAIREIKEEFGIDVQLSQLDQLESNKQSQQNHIYSLFNFYNESDISYSSKVFGQTYIVFYDKDDYKKQDEEVEEILVKSLEEIQEIIKCKDVTPDSKVAFEKLINDFSHLL